MSDYMLGLCSCPDAETAAEIALALVERRLAACVNVLPGVTSIYRWLGEVERAEEHLLVVKTHWQAYAELEATIQELHPYELPEVIAVNIEEGLPEYLAWISTNVEETHE
jgi:periplasmic divalent cation tolerance protein